MVADTVVDMAVADTVVMAEAIIVPSTIQVSIMANQSLHQTPTKLPKKKPV
jgi:hypothetical protein